MNINEVKLIQFDLLRSDNITTDLTRLDLIVTIMICINLK